jgi:hypothetical protein
MRVPEKQKKEAKQKAAISKPLRYHNVSGILVGPGIDKQPHKVHVTLFSGNNQRRRSVLSVPPTAIAKIKSKFEFVRRERKQQTK